MVTIKKLERASVEIKQITDTLKIMIWSEDMEERYHISLSNPGNVFSGMFFNKAWICNEITDLTDYRLGYMKNIFEWDN